MNFKKWKAFSLAVLLLATLSCSRPENIITTHPVPFAVLPNYANGIESPENSWYYQWSASKDEEELLEIEMPMQTDPIGNLYFIGRDRSFYSLDSSGALRWKKGNNFSPFLILVNENTLLTMIESNIRLYNTDGSVKEIWTSLFIPYLGPNGYIYSLLPQGKPSKMITFACLDAHGEIRWKANHELSKTCESYTESVWFDNNNNVYFFINHIENKMNTEFVLYSFTESGSARWKKSFPQNVNVQCLKSGQVIQSFMMFSLSPTMIDITKENSVWVIGLDLDGNEAWRKKEGYGNFPVLFQSCPDGRIVNVITSEKDQATYIKTYNNFGEIIWERKLVSTEVSPVLVDQESHIYIASGGSTGDRYLYAFYPDGTTKWKIKVPTSLSTKVNAIHLGLNKAIYLTLEGKNIVYCIAQEVP